MRYRPSMISPSFPRNGAFRPSLRTAIFCFWVGDSTRPMNLSVIGGGPGGGGGGPGGGWVTGVGPGGGGGGGGGGGFGLNRNRFRSAAPGLGRCALSASRLTPGDSGGA